ncbi:MAG: hypothetical protein N2376_03845 [Clostridia bacterium]|nr:hypothetical protein [Clostridia bacterium]
MPVVFGDHVGNLLGKSRNSLLIPQSLVVTLMDEIIHGVDIFKKMALLDIADASGLPCGIELMSKLIGCLIKGIVIL